MDIASPCGKAGRIHPSAPMRGVEVETSKGAAQ